MLPGENVCTENLTPWKKLLPCGAKRGLATFLNADHIHSTKYHNLGLSLRKVCPGHTNECSNPDIELSLFVVLVNFNSFFRLISKCPFGFFKSPKKPTKFFKGFLL